MEPPNGVTLDDLLEAHTIEDTAQPGQRVALKCACAWTGTALGEGDAHARANGLCSQCWGSREEAAVYSIDDSGIGPCSACSGGGTAKAEDATAKAAEELDKLLGDEEAAAAARLEQVPVPPGTNPAERVEMDLQDYAAQIEFTTSHVLSQQDGSRFWGRGSEFRAIGSKTYQFVMEIAAAQPLAAMSRIIEVAQEIVTAAGLTAPIDVLKAKVVRLTTEDARNIRARGVKQEA